MEDLLDAKTYDVLRLVLVKILLTCVPKQNA